jgi:hypothetical protein
MSIFDKWNKQIDVEGLRKDIDEASKSKQTGDFKEVPDGSYEVKVEKMELKASSKGDPMVSIWFRILEGEFKNSIIFLNQVITQGFQIHLMNEILRSMEAVDSSDVGFIDYKQYSDLLLEIFEKVDGHLEFVLEYGTNKKGYHTYKITDVFEV